MKVPGIILLLMVTTALASRRPDSNPNPCDQVEIQKKFVQCVAREGLVFEEFKLATACQHLDNFINHCMDLWAPCVKNPSQLKRTKQDGLNSELARIDTDEDLSDCKALSDFDINAYKTARTVFGTCDAKKAKNTWDRHTICSLKSQLRFFKAWTFSLISTAERDEAVCKFISETNDECLQILNACNPDDNTKQIMRLISIQGVREGLRLANFRANLESCGLPELNQLL